MTQHATAKIGAILVNINPAYRTHELAYVLDQSGARLLISATEFKSSDYRAMIEEVREESPLEQVVRIGTDDWAELTASDARESMQDLVTVQDPQGRDA